VGEGKRWREKNPPKKTKESFGKGAELPSKRGRRIAYSKEKRGVPSGAGMIARNRKRGGGSKPWGKWGGKVGSLDLDGKRVGVSIGESRSGRISTGVGGGVGKGPQKRSTMKGEANLKSMG